MGLTLLHLFGAGLLWSALPPALADRSDDDSGASPEYVQYFNIFGILLAVNASINCFSTIVSIALMVKLELHKRIFMSMVVLMTGFQLIYDFCLIPCTNVEQESCKIWRASGIGLGMFSGVASNAVTNQMAVIVAYILLTRKSLVIPNWLTAVHTLLPSLALGIPAFIGFLEVQDVLDNDDYVGHYFFTILQAYIILRGVQVLINFIATLVIIIILTGLDFGSMNVCGWSLLEGRKRSSATSDSQKSANPYSIDASNGSNKTISSDSTTNTSTTSSLPSTLRWFQSIAECIYNFVTCKSLFQFSSKIKRKNYPMFALAGRLIGYPIVQSLSRFGASWYELDQGHPVGLYLKTIMSSENRQLQTVELFAYCLLVPVGGLGCFIIFLRIETDARDLLKQWLYYLFTCGGSLDRDEEEPLSSQKGTRKAYYYKGHRYTFGGSNVNNSNKYDNEDGDYDSYDDSDSDESIDRDRFSYEAEVESVRSMRNESVGNRTSYTYGNTMAIRINRPSNDTPTLNPIQGNNHTSNRESAYTTRSRKNSNPDGNGRDRSRSRVREQGEKWKGNKVVVNLDHLIAGGDDTVAFDSNDGDQLMNMYKHLTDEEILDIIVLQADGTDTASKRASSNNRKSGNGVSEKARNRADSSRGSVKKGLAVLKESRHTHVNDSKNILGGGGGETREEELEMTIVD